MREVWVLFKEHVSREVVAGCAARGVGLGPLEVRFEWADMCGEASEGNWR